MDEYPHGQIRAVTHHDIAAADIDTIVAAVRSALEATEEPSADQVAAGQLQGV
jgi:hypothetical protein